MAFRGTPLPNRTVPMDDEIQQYAEEWAVRDSNGRDVATGTRAAVQSLVALKNAVELSGIPSMNRSAPSSLNCDSLAWL